MTPQLILNFTNLVFSVVLQSAPLPTGPWKDVAASSKTCPSTHTFTVQTWRHRHEFFRFIPKDNGIVPTPGKPHAYATNGLVHLSCPMVWGCDDMAMKEYRWYDDYQLVATTQSGSWTTSPSPGWHYYQVQAVTEMGESWITTDVLELETTP
jgi:hypothetical protein